MEDVARIDGRAPALLFLHEGLGSRSAWRDFPAALARATGHAAIVWSRAGYGEAGPRASWPPSFMHDEARALAVDEDTILIGHSDGASIALLYAAEQPVRALILEAPHVFVEDKTVASIAALRDVPGLVDKLGRHHHDAPATFDGWTSVWLDPAFRSWNIEACLPKVRASALVILGEDDEYGTAAQVEAVRRQLGAPCETLMLPECGHAPHRDQPARTLAAMAAFIARVSA
jgi:pimeloyl-ACP methyl ester carboxylesterase